MALTIDITYTGAPGAVRIAELRERYDLHMRVERYISADENEQAIAFIRE